MHKIYLLYCFLLAFTSSLIAQNNHFPKYEMRAAWIASVVNIDWPSKKGLSIEEQKKEYINIVNHAQKIGLNALFVQIRPATDALYVSSYEPWSEYLTGTQGKDPGYDPLDFMIKETHKRGLEFHAWLNPYRAVFDINHSSIATNHITRQRPELFINYGKLKIFDPGLPETRAYFINIIKDIIHRYNIDGIHLDDYFYPYPDAKLGSFPDHHSYNLYGKGMNRAEWRRENCNMIIKEIHELITQTKPNLRFGVSPFGIYKNKSQDHDGSDTRGLTNYHSLYADIIKWIKNGWIDYVVPQLYWPIAQAGQDYRILLDWWSKNTQNRHLYIGHAFYRGGSSALWNNYHELPNQIKLLRQNSQVQGSVYFSYKSMLENNRGWSDTLANNYYKHPALVPPMHWIDQTPSIAPEIYIQQQSMPFRISIAQNETIATEIIKQYVVYIASDAQNLGNTPSKIIPITSTTSKELIAIELDKKLLPLDKEKFYIAVSNVDKENNESALSNILRIEKQGNSWISIKGYNE